MERSTATLKVPTVPVPVELALAGDMRLRVQLFVPDRARTGRTQLALDLAAALDADPPFLPAREPGGHVVLYAKAAIAWVSIGLADPAPAADAEAAGDEPVVIENEPELGLSDDVFPAGAAADDAAEAQEPGEA